MQTRETITYKDLEEAIERTATKELQEIDNAYSTLRRLLPDEGFTERYNSIIYAIRARLNSLKGD